MRESNQNTVVYENNSASYKIETAEDNDYKQELSEEPQYNFDDVVMVKEAQEYAKEIDQQLFTNFLRIPCEKQYRSAEEQAQAEMYKLSIGLAGQFLLYAMRASTF